jgi:hypothetical protein
MSVELVYRILDILADGLRDAPMWATGLLVLSAWFIVKTYHKYKKNLVAILHR